MLDNIMYAVLGAFVGAMVLEPLIINFVYMSNVALFNDIILTKKSSEKLKKFYTEK